MATALADLEKQYQLSEDDAARIATEPEVILPKMMAKMHQTFALALERTLPAVIPQLFAQHQQATAAELSAKEAFFAKWPQLRAREAEALDVARTFRTSAAAKGITGDAAIERIGQMACLALGLPLPGAGTNTPSPSPTPTPAKPGFQPAGGSGGGRGPAPEADNPFTQMANEFADSDRD